MKNKIQCEAISGRFVFNDAPYKLRYIHTSQLDKTLDSLRLGCVIKKITEAADEASFFSAVQDRVRHYGFDTFSLGLAEYKAGATPILYVHSPLPYDVWLEYHVNEATAIDETMKHCATSTLPTTWKLSESQISKDLPKLADALKPYWALRVVWPVRVATGQIGMLCFNSGKEKILEEHSERFVQMLAEGQLLAQYICHQLISLGVLNEEKFQSFEQEPNLRDKEIELLILASKGIETPEMARLVGISQRTVNFHFANIFKKLGASNRIEAVAKAINLNLVNRKVMPTDQKFALHERILELL